MDGDYLYLRSVILSYVLEIQLFNLSKIWRRSPQPRQQATTVSLHIVRRLQQILLDISLNGIYSVFLHVSSCWCAWPCAYKVIAQSENGLMSPPDDYVSHQQQHKPNL